MRLWKHEARDALHVTQLTHILGALLVGYVPPFGYPKIAEAAQHVLTNISAVAPGKGAANSGDPANLSRPVSLVSR